MEIKLGANQKEINQIEVHIYPAFSQETKKDKSSKTTKKTKSTKKSNNKSPSVSISHLPKNLQEVYGKLLNRKSFSGAKGSTFTFHNECGQGVVLWGLGNKKDVKAELLRKESAKLFKAIAAKYSHASLDLDSFNLLRGHEKSAQVLTEAFCLSNYKFGKYLSNHSEPKLKTLHLITKQKSKAKIEKAMQEAKHVCSSVNVARDYINEPPNTLNSEAFAKFVEDDVKKNLKGMGVKVKVLDKAALKKEKMGLFLSVNAGSSYGPRLVHLTYTPKKANKNTKHIALVGKGLTFDTGGYSLKPPTSMINMKFDMGGAATVYGAFRSAVLNQSKNKVTCILGMTDNAVSGTATMPDSIVKARSGKTVEILNTDAEGRLVLADCLDYACDLKPDTIINAATLTGAILIALGHETCGLFSNNDKLVKDLMGSAKETDEYMWHLPIIDEFRNDMKSSIADLRNIGGSRFGGSAKAAAFLEEFIKDDIPWAHLDIAGIGDSQSHLPYCPSKGASGSIVRTLYQFLNK